ncbi:hypothetical protein B9G98_00347 [Wickerhamiella sorbophila]|uniref:Ubiquitin-like domain-containing protein n=1 Tax=Wickerhamiella sorbophila TaxID=45607 RepID=A0A2T0FCN0_9ASCO|nr:hypothetical protein B9G98_00347 [Wickerhamiella sorbophila]PRT52727.1 hypothetical protein B9G98_00347 [Wickerhamiella sorbophila]
MTDQKFVGEFMASLAPFQKKLDDNYEGTHKKPVVLGRMSAELEPLPAQEPKQVKVALRSIRNPKFSVEYEVPDTDSIFAVKERLLTDPNGPLVGTEFNLAGIRFMIKSRAISDTRQLRELSSTEFTVVLLHSNADNVPSSGQLYWADDSVIAPDVQTPTPVAETPEVVEETPSFPSEMWEEIAAVVAKYTKDSASVVDKLRRAVE